MSNLDIKVHDLKTWPMFFAAVWRGDKKAELRKNDRDFNLGDMLLLREWSPDTGQYTGDWIMCRITNIVSESEFGLTPGYVMLSIKVEGKHEKQ